MIRSLRLRAHACVLFVASLFAACSSSTADPPGGDDAAAGIPNPSFKTDIVGLTTGVGMSTGILRLSCALSSSCHKDPDRPMAGLWLGPQNSDPDPSTADLQKIYNGLLQASTIAPPMPRVTKGDLSQSFLIHKLDHDENTSNITCTGTGVASPDLQQGLKCGEGMPESSSALEPPRLATMKNWILNGAPNN